MSDNINSHICLMLSVYNSFPQMVKYNRFEIGFQQLKTGLPKKPVLALLISSLYPGG